MVKLQLVMDRAERNSSMETCLPNQVKSTGELPVLRNVPASLVVCPSGEDQPVVCPSVGQSERSKHKLDGLEFIQKRVVKAKTKLYNIHRQNCAGRRGNFADLPPQNKAALEWPVKKDVRMVEPLAMMPPPPPTATAKVAVPVALLPEEDVPMMVDPAAYNASGAPMTLDGEPRHGSYLFEVLDACDVNGDGSGLPTKEELHAIFVKAGISTSFLQPN